VEINLNQLKRSKRELKRIDWKTVKRVVSTLHQNARIKKTLLATACNMGYDKCLLYVDWLEMMELVRKEINEDGYEGVILTEKGRSLYSKKFNIENFYDQRNHSIEDL
jgi:predicted transcriptional regulator